MRSTPEGIKEYFGAPNGFLSKTPVITAVPERVIQKSDNNVAIDSGIYHFSLAVSGAMPLLQLMLEDAAAKYGLESHWILVLCVKGGNEARARYTFVYKKVSPSEWRIAYHHSSVLPAATAEVGLAQQHILVWFQRLLEGEWCDAAPSDPVGC